MSREKSKYVEDQKRIESSYMDTETMTQIKTAVGKIIGADMGPLHLAQALLACGGFTLAEGKGAQFAALALSTNALTECIVNGLRLAECQCDSCTAKREQAVKDANAVLMSAKA